MNRDTVIFDMDGVIFDTERIYLDIWKKIYPKHGYEMTLEFYLTSVISYPCLKHVLNF